MSESAPMSDGDRLIATLQTCFRELLKNQEEQGDRLYRTLEALKPPAPTADRKTTFWNTYMKLADEHDKEFSQKYGTDLDTTLIFAGLFSAVSSAFIIQIQPLLVSNVPTTIVVVQSMLYISLFTTLLAALLAVLGKQWIMYYGAAGSRGTIEERGLERQRKLDGLVKWKFETVLQMFPLLLQLALLLFATSMSVFLFTVHRLIAIIVLVLTAIGLGSYLFLLVSAAIYPDSPFQTPLTPFLGQLVSPGLRWIYDVLRALRWTIGRRLLLLPRDSVLRLLPRFAPKEQLRSDPTDSYKDWDLAPTSPEVPAVLWILGTSTDPMVIGTAAEMGLDLQWPIEWDDQSALAVVVRLGGTLTSTFEEPGFTDTVRKGMSHIAIPCAKLFCMLSLVTQRKPDLWILHLPHMSAISLKTMEFNLVLNLLRQQTDVLQDWIRSPATLRWVLYLIPFQKPRHFISHIRAEEFMTQFSEYVPRLDPPSFTNYLCCVWSFFSPMKQRIIVQMDKSGLWDVLLTGFFRVVPADTLQTSRILHLTAKLATGVVGRIPRRCDPVNTVNVIQGMLRFCNSLPREAGWLGVVISAAKLIRVNHSDLHSTALQFYRYFSPHRELPTVGAQEITGIYMALEHVPKVLEEGSEPDAWDSDTILAVDGLLQVLACNSSLPDDPPLQSLRVILLALSASTDVAFTAFLVLSRAKSWFLSPKLHPVMHQFPVVRHLGRVALEFQDEAYLDFLQNSYFDIIRTVATRPEWRPALWAELPTWLRLFPESSFYDGIPKTFISVIQSVWVPEFDEQHHFRDEREYCVALSLAALSNVWGATEFPVSPPALQFVSLVDCTVSTALYFIDGGGMPGPAMAIFYTRLCESLAQAAAKAKAAILSNPAGADSGLALDIVQFPNRLALFAEELAGEFSVEFGPSRWSADGLTSQSSWKDFRRRLGSTINAYEDFV
ncbi:hypothetical protein B0H16DRAFT_391966 [Mycena metata]|uniref:DUF6535 domain-containing protein n=1 Tax=Mycena metata TaxID=1033252 RepID=A0AAD7MJD0_9AGAR|nr:hypothetical protein B0H16DRAFT_391966 [Mycena metata]